MPNRVCPVAPAVYNAIQKRVRRHRQRGYSGDIMALDDNWFTEIHSNAGSAFSLHIKDKLADGYLKKAGSHWPRP